LRSSGACLFAFVTRPPKNVFFSFAEKPDDDIDVRQMLGAALEC
jgi:hypothetical protein